MKNGFPELVFYTTIVLFTLPAGAASTQATLSGQYPIYASVAQYEQIKAVSEFDCGFYNASSSKCTLRWTLSYESLDPNMSPFKATWDKRGINLTASLGINARSRTWESEVFNGQDVGNPAKNSPGTISFSGINGLPNTAAAVEYYSHPSQTTPTTPSGGIVQDIKGVLNSVGDSVFLKNSIIQNPTLASFNSLVTLIAPASYEYSYEVSNATDAPLFFDWTDTGRSGTVDPNQVLAWSMISEETPYAVYGSMNATVLGGEFAGPSSTILPADAALGAVPLPAPVWLLATALAALGIGTRKQAAPHDRRWYAIH